MNPVWAGLLGFILLQLALGAWVARRVRSSDDYWLAGRTLGFWLVMPSMFATWFGAETCVSAAAGFYEEGLGGGAAEPFGYGLCIVFFGLVFANRLHRMGLLTFADFYRRRFSPAAERLAAIILVPTSVLWAAAQIRAFGQVVSAGSGWSPHWGIALAALVAVVYTTLGGLRADVITDCLQGGIIILGLGALGWAIVQNQGGWTATARLIEPGLRWGGSGTGWLETLEAWAVPVCGSVVAQELLARALAARSPGVARSAAVAGGLAYVAVGAVPSLLGLVGLALMPGLEHPEQVLPRLAETHLSAGLYAIFSGALIAAILSTVDSSLLAASAVLSANLLRRGGTGDVPNQPTAVSRARLITAICGLAAMGLALSAESIYDLVEASSAFGGAGMFVLLGFGLFTRMGGPHAGWMTLVAGILGWLVAGPILGGPCPYVTSMAVSAATFLAVVLGGRLRMRLRADS